MIRHVRRLQSPCDARSILTDAGYTLEASTPRLTGFEFTLAKPTPIEGIDTVGPLAAIELYDGKSLVRIATGACPELSSFRLFKWARVVVEFDPVTAPTQLRVAIREQRAELGPFPAASLDEDLALVCKGQTVMINSVVALASSEKLQGNKHFLGQQETSVDLSDFSLATVLALKQVLLSREVPHDLVTPELVQLMGLMLIKGRESVWPVVRRRLCAANAVEWLRTAHLLGDDETAQAAKRVILDDMRAFEVTDVVAFCAAIKAKA